MKPAGVSCLLTIVICINHSAWIFYWCIFDLRDLIAIKHNYWDLKGQHYLEGGDEILLEWKVSSIATSIDRKIIQTKLIEPKRASSHWILQRENPVHGFYKDCEVLKDIL